MKDAFPALMRSGRLAVVTTYPFGIPHSIARPVKVCNQARSLALRITLGSCGRSQRKGSKTPLLNEMYRHSRQAAAKPPESGKRFGAVPGRRGATNGP